MIAIDWGSNTLRITQLDCQTGRFTASFEKIVKSADGLFKSGRINEEAVKRVIDALAEAKQAIDFASDEIYAVTTETIRRADNGKEVLEQIRQKTGVSFEIISGEREARLTLTAVEHRMHSLGRLEKLSSFVLIDIGGGSTELIFRYPDQVVTQSFPVGIVTIAQACETLEEIAAALPGKLGEAEQFARESIARYGMPNAFVATAGTPTTVAAMKLGQTYATYDPVLVNGTSLGIEELDHFLGLLLRLPFAEREVMVGVGRSDLIAAGILIFRALFGIVGKRECVVIDDGLREGLALERCRKKTWINTLFIADSI